ncbi:MAG: hypothetical protein SNJ53_02520, partial [Thermodesulfovibrionales bacterium]
MPSICYSNTNQAYQQAKESFENFNKVYSVTHETINTTHEFFAKFNRGVTTWRNAVSRETQNRGIEEIDTIPDERIEAVIDALFEKAKETVGVSLNIEIPQSMKDKATEKLRIKFKDKVPPRVANRLGYMYTLSSVDRKLRENGTYEKIQMIKDGFDKGSKLLNNFKNVMQFIDIFSPQSDTNTPVGRLKNVNNLLSLISEIAKPIPLMSNIIDNYARVTESFEVALEDLDKKLKDARQGSLCGQRGVDTDIQNFFNKHYPAEDCLTYFALASSQYPHLSPIRGWIGGERTQIFLWFDNEGTMINGSNFQIIYSLFSALKDSYNYAKYARQDSLFYLMKAVHKSDIKAIVDRFNAFYMKFEKDYKFKEVLEMEGLLKGVNYISLNGNTMDYSMGSSQEEFIGLCFFNSRFRDDVRAIYDKYKDAYVINGNIKTNPPSVVIGKISVLVDNEPAKDLKCAESCTFRHLIFKDRYAIKVTAEGFKDFNKTFVRDYYPYVDLAMASMKINADKKTVLVGDRVVLTAIVEGNVTQIGKFYWSINGSPYGGDTDRAEFIPNQAGVYKVNVTMADQRGRPMLEAFLSVNVIERLSLFIQGPSDVEKGLEATLYAQIKGGLPNQKYSYTWSLNGQKYGGNDNFIKVKIDKEGSYSIKATLWEWAKELNSWKKITDASHNIAVKPPQPMNLGVKLIGPSTGDVGIEFAFYANIQDENKLKDILKDSQPRISYSWQVNNRAYGGHQDSQRIRFDTAGKHTITVIAWVWKPVEKKWIKIGDGRHYFDAIPKTITYVLSV